MARIPLPKVGTWTVSLDSWEPLHTHLISPVEKNIRTSESIDLPDGTKAELDDEMASLAVTYLEKHGPLAMFVYFHQVDSAGHAHGFHPSVAQYIEAIENVDRNLRDVIEAVETRQKTKQEDWLVIVCTDHGGRGTGHGGGHEVEEIRQTFLILWQPGEKFGTKLPATEIVDVVPTALQHRKFQSTRLEVGWETSLATDRYPTALEAFECSDRGWSRLEAGWEAVVVDSLKVKSDVESRPVRPTCWRIAPEQRKNIPPTKAQ